ncbi:MAG: hypothetical protein RLP14_02670 [Owenweeksia sp.]
MKQTLFNNVFLPLSLFVISLTTQGQDTASVHYEKAFQTLEAMLVEKEPATFKKAVLTAENAYFDSGLDTAYFNQQLNILVRLTRAFIEAHREGFIYKGGDREKVLIYAGVYKVMTDTLPIILELGDTVYHLPFHYDFEDIAGHFNWTKMFVSKLVSSHTGNCHSLPYLYKILVEELGVKTHLALAPNHVYIKHRSQELGMYNTELTSGSFPIDAWLMASGYVHLDAIRNRLYMEALSDQQSIALCLVDLAQGYQHKYGMGDGQFILKCCETALKYYPNYINALLLKTDVLRTHWEALAQERNEASTKQEQEELTDTVLTAFNNMQELVGKIHDLGYRRMPDAMYLDWLNTLKTERDKYENPKINATFNNQ